MANFTEIKPGGWAELDPLEPEEISEIQEDLLKCPNLTDGSDHAPTDPFGLGGAGLELQGTGTIHWRRVELDYSGAFAGTFAIGDGDIAAVTDLDGSNQDFTLSDTGAQSGDRIQVCNAASSYSLTVYDAGAPSTPLAVLSPGNALDVQFNGTAWVAPRGDYAGTARNSRAFTSAPYALDSVDAATIKNDGYGGDHYFDSTGGVSAFFRVRPLLKGSAVVTSVTIYLDGQTHGTWAPAVMPTLDVYQYNPFNGVTSLLGTVTDSSDQSTFEARHAISVTGLTADFTSEQLLIAKITNEHGTNAVANMVFSTPIFSVTEPV